MTGKRTRRGARGKPAKVGRKIQFGEGGYFKADSCKVRYLSHEPIMPHFPMQPGQKDIWLLRRAVFMPQGVVICTYSKDS